MQRLLETHEAFCLTLRELLYRDTGPLGDHTRDVGLGDVKFMLLLLRLPAL